jgi:hypothetical protein
MKRRHLASIIALAITACAGSELLAAAPEPLIDGLGSYSRKITTKSPKAQRYFTQGSRCSTVSTTPPRSARSRKPRGKIPNARWRIGPIATRARAAH